ncbi:S-adenosylmethionine-dependent methyltransferase Rv2258c-like [Asterias amurensis]|uniref:S-adenosylmethionine-dependent methyltransferase Rv2258c-like n=1 Tax=Asterias amurensis TaxID=7602 RepID=UPI003AB2127A
MADSGKQAGDDSKQEFSSRMMDVALSGLKCVAIAMGKETGLFDVMIATETPKTSQEIADAGNLKERYVREWLGAMVTAKIVNYDPSTETYWIPKSHHSITQFTGLAMCTPSLSTAFFDVADSFRKDGPSGVPYSKYSKFDDLMDGMHGPLFKNELAEFTASMPDVQKKLESGIKVLDIGCGPGASTLEFAKHFPKSTIYGLDLSESGIKNAQEVAKASGLTNTVFRCQDVSSLPSDWTSQFDYAFAHMVIHDLADPTRVLKEILRLLTPGGALSVLDPNAHSKLEDNISEENEHASMLYTISMMNCIPACLSQNEGKGAALGAALGREKATLLLEGAGYHVKSITTALGGSLHYLCFKS